MFCLFFNNISVIWIIDHSIIDLIINTSGLFKKKPSLKKDQSMLRIIVYEVLFGEKSGKDSIDSLWTRYDKIN